MSKVGKKLVDRIERSGDMSAGAFHLAADLVAIVAAEAEGWTNRADDAVRIPDMLFEAVQELRGEVEKLEESLQCPSCKHVDILQSFDCGGADEGNVFCPACQNEFRVDENAVVPMSVHGR